MLHWVRRNLFSSWINAIATLIAIYIVISILIPAVDFVLIDGVWQGGGRKVCLTQAQGGAQPNGWFGGCFAYVRTYFPQFIYGLYPIPQRWRVDVVFVLFFASLAPLLVPAAPFKRANIIFMLVVFPVTAFVLLTGGHVGWNGFLIAGSALGRSFPAFVVDYLILTAVIMGIAYAIVRGTQGNPKPVLLSIGVVMAVLLVLVAITAIDFGLPYVETARWGGLLVTLVIAVTGIAVSLPLGIVLALGRRSVMPIVRLFSIIFIEFWRGIPLVTVLFMASVVLPLFLPDGVNFDKLVRALVGVAMFSSAYMAEVIRGGLQAIPKGQYEGAKALGLSFWQMMGNVVLPQALKIVIPGIVNTFIGLFKDTTLVLIIGLFDFLGQIQASFSDSDWATPVQAITAYSFAAAVYFVFCFSMGQYSRYMERRLDTGHRS
ncbi:amino acid ABC transporter permease [Pararhizobium mangrovi]|uniref:Amino acid ABC transporter permease n=2 Tax=Pararhizobium mangrovi TaxID=2590452 RepID=A0A506UI71_9HYPH|nr:amino acid ABC transporter permease [Pararhizobium mangrovi]